MFCRDCHYNLAGLPQQRCPECGRAFDPLDATTFVNSLRNRPVRARVRCGIVAAVFGMWYVFTMQNASANTSWEHHPFAGVFIIIKESLTESHAAGDWALALLVWGFFFAFPLYWIVSGKTWAALVAIALCALTVAVSCQAAVWASC
jgi:hypothetical protein